MNFCVNCPAHTVLLPQPQELNKPSLLSRGPVILSAPKERSVTHQRQWSVPMNDGSCANGNGGASRELQSCGGG